MATTSPSIWTRWGGADYFGVVCGSQLDPCRTCADRAAGGGDCGGRLCQGPTAGASDSRSVPRRTSDRQLSGGSWDRSRSGIPVPHREPNEERDSSGEARAFQRPLVCARGRSLAVASLRGTRRRAGECSRSHGTDVRLAVLIAACRSGVPHRSRQRLAAVGGSDARPSGYCLSAELCSLQLSRRERLRSCLRVCVPAGR